MTPDESARLGRVEAELRSLTGTIGAMSGKVDTLIEARKQQHDDLLRFCDERHDEIERRLKALEGVAKDVTSEQLEQCGAKRERARLAGWVKWLVGIAGSTGIVGLILGIIEGCGK